MSRGFPLAGLLRLRHLQEEQAAAELALAHADRRSAERRRRETAEALAGTHLPEHGGDTVWRAAIAARAAMSALSLESATALQVAGAQVDGATGLWTAARTRATALEHLEERHEVLARAEDERLEQLVLDEAAARIHRDGASDLDGSSDLDAASDLDGAADPTTDPTTGGTR